MSDTPDAATARARLEGRREGYAQARIDQGAYSTEAAASAALRRYPDPAPPAPKRLGLLTDEQLEWNASVLRTHTALPRRDAEQAGDFLDAARVLAAEVPDDLNTVRRLRDSFATGSISHDYWDAIYRVLARLAGLPATEDPDA